MESTVGQFTIDRIDHNARLDVFLARVCHISRSKVQKYIKQSGVEINNETTYVPHAFLETGDVVEVADVRFPYQKDETITDVDPMEKKGELPQLDILFEDENVIVLNKAAGVLVHPTPSSNEYTLMDALIEHTPGIAEVGDKPEERAGIVHRLDRMTSGVMIAAKTQEAFDDLKHKFQKRFVYKKYRALVAGSLQKDYDTVLFKIVRSKSAGRMVARPESQEGKEASTDYEVIQRYANATEVDVDLHTGRTHQIRAHFHALGNPVVGDPLYVIKSVKQIPFPRLWLHAYQLTLALPGKHEARTFTVPLPPELTELTDRLHKV
ncbi:TPA: RNA pseudouridine synthase [Candidatus Uhrbacteria bacterium]|nr:RNA pseudouridine synthase [Candidatus Uhrbacteria bacterium]